MQQMQLFHQLLMGSQSDAGCGDQDGNGDDMATDFDKKSWMIAVAMAVVAALLNNIGVNLQKLSWTTQQRMNTSSTDAESRGIGMDHSSNVSATQDSLLGRNSQQQQQQHPATNAMPTRCSYRTYWMMGMVGIVVASILDFAALAFGPQSVIAPLGSLTMVANGFVAPWMHGEAMQKQVLTSTIVIISGCFASVASASHSNKICGIEAMLEMYTSIKSCIYVALVMSIMLTWIVMARRFEGVEKSFGKDSPQYQSVFKVHRVLYAGISGIFGAQSVVFAKSIDVLMVSSIRGDKNFLEHPATYALVAGLVLCIAMQLYWLNLGLARFEALYNVPVFTSTWIVGTSFAGGVLFGEFNDFNVFQAFAFPFGVFLCCMGVFFLSQTDTEE